MIYAMWHTLHLGPPMTDEPRETDASPEGGSGTTKVPPYIPFQTLLTFIKQLKTDG